MRQQLLNSEQVTLTDVNAGQLSVRVTTGEADGCVEISGLTTYLMEQVNKAYGASSSNEINEADGVVFIVNGADEYKNVSLTTLRSTILDVNSMQGITPSTKIFVENGYITYQELRDKLHLDFFGN